MTPACEILDVQQFKPEETGGTKDNTQDWPYMESYYIYEYVYLNMCIQSWDPHDKHWLNKYICF